MSCLPLLFKSYLPYTSQFFLSCKYKRIETHYLLFNNCNLVTSYNWDFCLQKHLSLTTCSLQQQYENKPINSWKLFKRKKKKKDKAKVLVVQHIAANSTVYGSISEPYGASFYLHWQQLDVYHWIQKNRAKTPTLKKRLSDGICVEYPNKSKYLTPLLYSKCLDTTTIQDRTGLSQEEKGEVIAVFNYLMGGYREGGARLFWEVKHKKTGGNGQGLQQGKFQIGSRKICISHGSQKLKCLLRRGYGISILEDIQTLPVYDPEQPDVT